MSAYDRPTPEDRRRISNALKPKRKPVDYTTYDVEWRVGGYARETIARNLNKSLAFATAAKSRLENKYAIGEVVVVRNQ